MQKMDNYMEIWKGCVQPPTPVIRKTVSTQSNIAVVSEDALHTRVVNSLINMLWIASRW